MVVRAKRTDNTWGILQSKNTDNTWSSTALSSKNTDNSWTTNVVTPSGEVPGAPAFGSTDYSVPSTNVMWVDPAGANGTGTQTSPKSSVANALAASGLTNDGTIVLKTGTYREGTVTNTNKRVTIQAAPGASPVMTGSDVITGWTKLSGVNVWVTNFSAQMRRDVVGAAPTDLNGLPHNLASWPDQAFIDGVPMEQVPNKADVTPGSNKFYVDYFDAFGASATGGTTLNFRGPSSSFNTANVSGVIPDSSWVGGTVTGSGITGSRTITAVTGTWPNIVITLNSATTLNGTGSFDYTNNKLYIGTDPTVSGRVVEATVRQEGYKAQIAGCKLLGIKFKHYGNSLNQQGAIKMQRSNCRVQDCFFEFNAGPGLTMGKSDVATTGMVVNHCTLNNNGQMGLHSDNTDTAFFEWSWMHDNNKWAGSGKLFTGFAHGGHKTNETTNSEFRNNLYENNFAHGLWLDVYSNNAKIYNNESRGNINSGLFFEYGNTCIFANNYCHNNTNHGIQAYGYNLNIWNNTVADNGDNGFDIYRGDRDPDKNEAGGNTVPFPWPCNLQTVTATISGTTMTRTGGAVPAVDWVGRGVQGPGIGLQAGVKIKAVNGNTLTISPSISSTSGSYSIIDHTTDCNPPVSSTDRGAGLPFHPFQARNWTIRNNVMVRGSGTQLLLQIFSANIVSAEAGSAKWGDLFTMNEDVGTNAFLRNNTSLPAFLEEPNTAAGASKDATSTRVDEVNVPSSYKEFSTFSESVGSTTDPLSLNIPIPAGSTTPPSAVAAILGIATGTNPSKMGYLG